MSSTAPGAGGSPAACFAASWKRGAGWISLETGVQDAFAPARALYLAEGFESCPPFRGYGPDPNSAFLTRAL